MTFIHTTAGFGQPGQDKAAEALKSVPTDRALTERERGRLYAVATMGDGVQQQQAEQRLAADDKQRDRAKSKTRRGDDQTGSVFGDD